MLAKRCMRKRMLCDRIKGIHESEVSRKVRISFQHRISGPLGSSFRRILIVLGRSTRRVVVMIRNGCMPLNVYRKVVVRACIATVMDGMPHKGRFGEHVPKLVDGKQSTYRHLITWMLHKTWGILRKCQSTPNVFLTKDRG